MKTGWIVGIVMAYVIMLVFCIVCDQSWFNGETLKTLHTLEQPPPVVGQNLPIIGPIIGGIAAIVEWILNLFDIIFLRFRFWSGSYMILWYIFCLPIGVGLVASIIITLVRGAPSS